MAPPPPPAAVAVARHVAALTSSAVRAAPRILEAAVVRSLRAPALFAVDPLAAASIIPSSATASGICAPTIPSSATRAAPRALEEALVGPIRAPAPAPSPVAVAAAWEFFGSLSPTVPSPAALAARRFLEALFIGPHRSAAPAVDPVAASASDLRSSTDALHHNHHHRQYLRANTLQAIVPVFRPLSARPVKFPSGRRHYTNWAWTPWDPKKPEGPKKPNDLPTPPPGVDEILKLLDQLKPNKAEEARLKEAFMLKFYAHASEDPKSLNLKLDILLQRDDEGKKAMNELLALAKVEKPKWGTFTFFGKRLDITSIVAAIIGLF